jgi:hypothetical protein
VCLCYPNVRYGLVKRTTVEGRDDAQMIQVRLHVRLTYDNVFVYIVGRQKIPWYEARSQVPQGSSTDLQDPASKWMFIHAST